MGPCVLVLIHVHVTLCVPCTCVHVSVYAHGCLFQCPHGRNHSEPSTCTRVHACAHTHTLAEAGKSHPDTNLSLKPRMTFWRRMTLSVMALSRSTSSSMSWWSWRAEPSEQSPHQPLQSQGRGCPKWAPLPLLRELVPNGFHTCYGAMGQPPSSTDKVLSRLVPRGLGGTHAAGGAQHAHTLTPSQWPSLP